MRDSATVPVCSRTTGTLRESALAEIAWGPLPRGEFALEARGQSSVAANDANTVFAPGYGLLALRAQCQQPLPWGLLELLGCVQNLADWRVVGSVIVNDGNQRFFEPSPDRGWVVGATWVLPW